MVQEFKAGKHPLVQRLEGHIPSTVRYIYGPKEDQDVPMVNKQESGESLRRYLVRFTEESNKVDRFDDGDAIAAIIEGLRTSDFLKSVVGRVPSTMAELMTRADLYGNRRLSRWP